MSKDEQVKKETKEVSLFSKLWKKFSTLVLKSFRGLLCEKKHGEWELSIGRVASWIVLSHCLYVWNKTGQVIEQIANSESISDLTSVMIQKAEVSDGELTVLLVLLGYNGLKVVGDSANKAVVTWKQK